MPTRAVVIASIVAGLCAPMTALAENPSPVCVSAPLDTVGAHVEVGDEEVHVPAVSDAALCAVVWPAVGESAPVRFIAYPNCGFPCFALVVEDGNWMVVSTRAAVYLRYEADGVPTQVGLLDLPIGVHGNNPNPVCVAMGNPIPPCPSSSVAIPLPAPVP